MDSNQNAQKLPLNPMQHVNLRTQLYVLTCFASQFNQGSQCLDQEAYVAMMCRNDELSWLFTNRLSATRKMKVKRMGITEILR